jgi:hypothetical protein
MYWLDSAVDLLSIPYILDRGYMNLHLSCNLLFYRSGIPFDAYLVTDARPFSLCQYSVLYWHYYVGKWNSVKKVQLNNDTMNST